MRKILPEPASGGERHASLLQHTQGIHKQIKPFIAYKATYGADVNRAAPGAGGARPGSCRWHIWHMEMGLVRSTGLTKSVSIQWVMLMKASPGYSAWGSRRASRRLHRVYLPAARFISAMEREQCAMTMSARFCGAIAMPVPSRWGHNGLNSSDTPPRPNHVLMPEFADVAFGAPPRSPHALTPGGTSVIQHHFPAAASGITQNNIDDLHGRPLLVEVESPAV